MSTSKLEKFGPIKNLHVTIHAAKQVNKICKFVFSLPVESIGRKIDAIKVGRVNLAKRKGLLTTYPSIQTKWYGLLLFMIISV